jgi:hypothetical protein
MRGFLLSLDFSVILILVDYKLQKVQNWTNLTILGNR